MFHPTKRQVTSVRTSGVDKQYPFQVEIATGMPLRCHLGRVSEKESIEAHGQQTQKSWPHRSNKITQKGLQKPKSFNRTELQHKDYPVVTGSAKIHQISGHGRATYGSAVAVSPDKGYAEWPRAGMQEKNYVILHREVDDPDAETPISKWCLSSVAEAAITSSDIVVAMVTNWQSVVQIWRSDIIWNSQAGAQPAQVMLPPPDDGFYYIATGSGGGAWFGQFMLYQEIVQGVPSQYMILKINSDVNGWQVHPMFEEPPV